MPDAPYRLIPLHAKNGSIRAHAIVDVEDFERLGKLRWYQLKSGYVVRKDRQGRTVYLHRAVLGLPHGDPRQGDHEHGNRLDNRHSELRIVTPAQNSQNRVKPNARNVSGYRGVVWDRQTGRWLASVRLKGRNIHLGRFDDPAEGGRVTAAWRRDHMPFAKD